MAELAPHLQHGAADMGAEVIEVEPVGGEGTRRLPVRLQPPPLGEHTGALLQGPGYSVGQIEALRKDGLVA